MTDAPQFLAVNHVLYIHRRMIDDFGGAATVRDHGLLESAVMMPAARFEGHFLHDGIPAMAAAYFFHLCKNHPFTDGNKRTALASAEVFLGLNGMRMDADNKELEEFTLGVAASKITKEQVIAFFQKRAVPEER